MKNQRLAILGLGRSGLAVGKAAVARGALVKVFDESPYERLSKPEIVDEARSLGLDVELGWKGSLQAGSWDGLIVNPAIRKEHPKIAKALEIGIPILSEVEFAFRISRAPIIAITGTNGKSTTTVMTWLCLKACGIDAILCGNIFGSGYLEVPLTDAANESTPDQVLVAEVSSFGLDWVSTFKPAVAGITNITPDHLDRYSTFEEYAEAKLRVFRNQDSSDFAVVRANDPVVRPPGEAPTEFRSRRTRIAPSVEVDRSLPTVFTFGAGGRDARVEENSISILDKVIKINELPFREPHNLSNACMAGLLAYSSLKWIANQNEKSLACKLLRDAEKSQPSRPSAGYGAKSELDRVVRALPAEIIAGLKDFKGLAHRMEFLGVKDGVRVINNSMCTNPDAVLKSAQSVKDPLQLLIGGANKHLDFKPLANYLANGRHGVFLFGSDATSLNGMLGGRFPTFATLGEAFEAAAHSARSGQTIMLAPGCASNDQFRDFRDRGEVFKTLVREWLES